MSTFFDKKLLRLNKLKSNIHLELSKILKLYPNLIDEAFLNHSFSLVEIDLTKDLKIATCFIQVYDCNDKGKECLKLFHTHTKRIRFLLTQALNPKYSFELKFAQFTNYTPVEEVNRILDILEQNTKSKGVN